ncbi:hypothetical protein E1264_01885 [Actinomadura sp. KC216]|uniref:hypothetical protein n=1 Tax=Actinomadura sp. KC216 TaxID=2530370 RepID=UPI001045BD2B|nr:hypothetical protein [Actinomadura sp. KC216]TDB91404.1 hypothetical protein E1264_01885 [Actinomadura sp. KC216]
MKPERALGGRFGRGARLRRLWDAADAEPDPARAAEMLREVAAGIASDPAYAEFWPQLLESMLAARLLPELTDVDFGLLESRGLQYAEAIAGDGASGDPGTALMAALLPLAAARRARGEGDAATGLLTRLCRSPYSGPHVVARAAAELAAHGAVGRDQLSIYAEVTGRAERPPDAVAALVAGLLSVRHDSGTIRIAQAGELAAMMASAGAARPDLDRTLGLHRLMVDGAPHDAVAPLTRAWRAAPADESAFAGLLAALLRSGAHGSLAELAADPARPRTRAVEELIRLGRVLAWLDDPADPAPAPAGAARLTGFTVAAQAGEWLDYAIGRLYLLEGDSRRAAELLAPLAEAFPGRPGWDYHAAWALYLRGDREGVAARFDRVRGRPEAWAVRCVLCDIDPAAGDAEADASAAPPGAYSALAAARTELIQGGRPPAEPSTWLADDGALPDHLEALRTVLALRFARHNQYALTQATALPLFQRLPAPERLLWSGLAELETRPDRARELLTEAARAHGYGRAALVLAAHDAQEGRPTSALHLLDGPEAPSGPKAELLRTWLAASLGDEEETAADRLERLEAHTLPKARYSLGHLRLHQAIRQQARGRPDDATRSALQAKEDFDRAAAAGPRLVPPDTRALARAAELFATGQAGTDTLGKLRRRAAGHPWATWVLGLAELTAGQPGAGLDLGLCGQLVNQVGGADGDPAAPAVTALAGVLARASVLAGGERAAELSGLLGGLAERNVPAADPLVLRRLHHLSRAAVVRAVPPRRAAGDPPADLPGALAAARHALAGGDRAEALRLLDGASAIDADEARVRAILTTALGGPAADDPGELAPPDGAPARIAAALRLARAAGLADTDPEACRKLLLEALAEDEIADLVDLGRVMPALCAAPGRGGGARPRQLAALLRKVVVTTRFEPLTLARCATAVGDHQMADSAWRDALRAGGAGDLEAVREEYGRYLCHRATAARRGGDLLEAARLLHRAAGVLDDDEPEELLPEEDEIAEVRRLYEERLATLTGVRARILAAEWARSLERFREHAAAKAVSRALGHFEELQALAHTGSLRGRWES